MNICITYKSCNQVDVNTFLCLLYNYVIKIEQTNRTYMFLVRSAIKVLDEILCRTQSVLQQVVVGMTRRSALDQILSYTNAAK